MFEARRLKMVRVSPECIAILCLKDSENNKFTLSIKSEIPKDAVLIETGHFDTQRRVFFFVFEHESFDPVWPGDLIPEAKIPLITQYWEAKED